MINNETNDDDLFNSDSDSTPSTPIIQHNNTGNTIGQPISSLTSTQMLKSSTFYFLFAALFCCSFYGNMFYNLYKVIFDYTYIIGLGRNDSSAKREVQFRKCEMGGGLKNN